MELRFEMINAAEGPAVFKMRTTSTFYIRNNIIYAELVDKHNSTEKNNKFSRQERLLQNTVRWFPVVQGLWTSEATKKASPTFVAAHSLPQMCSVVDIIIISQPVCPEMIYTCHLYLSSSRVSTTSDPGCQYDSRLSSHASTPQSPGSSGIAFPRPLTIRHLSIYLLNPPLACCILPSPITALTLLYFIFFTGF